MHGIFGSASSWTNSFGPTSLRLALELAVAASGAWLAMHLARTGRERRRVWRVAIALMVLVTVAELTGAARLAALALPSRTAESATPPIADGATRKRSAPPSAPLPSSAAESPADVPWAIWLGRLWLGGTLALGFGIGVSHLLLARLRCRLRPAACDLGSARLIEQLGIGRPIRIGICPGTQSPFVFGIWRPTLVLPESYPPELSNEHRAAILVHELAHLAGSDPKWQLLADLATALVWWHPAVWFARAQLRRAAEESADEASLVLPEGPLFLAESLLAFGRRRLQQRWCAGLTMLGRSRSRLSRRVHILMDLSPARARGRCLGIRSGVALVAVVMVTVGSAAARSDLFVEDSTMGVRTVWQTSLVGLALTAAWPAEAPAQDALPRKAIPPTDVKFRVGLPLVKSEEAAASAIGLNDDQRDQFHALLKKRHDSLEHFHAAHHGDDHAKTGAQIGENWHDGLKKLLTDEQHSRYVEYWKTNVVTVQPSENGVTATLAVAEHPLDKNAQWLDGLDLTPEQSKRIGRLKSECSLALAAIQKLVESPENLPEATKKIAVMQRQRNEGLKSILTAEQYAKYRENLLAALDSGSPGGGEIKRRMGVPIGR